MAKKDEKDEKPPEDKPTGPALPSDEKPPEEPAAPVKLEVVKPNAIPVSGEIEKVDPKELNDAKPGDKEEGGIPWTVIGIVLAVLIIGAGLGYYVLKTQGSSGAGKGPAPAK